MRVREEVAVAVAVGLVLGAVLGVVVDRLVLRPVSGAGVAEEPPADVAEDLGEATGADRFVERRGPTLPGFGELEELSRSVPASPAVEAKLASLRRTPFVSNEAHRAGANPRAPRVGDLGPVLRVVSWNIERGLRLDAIVDALGDPEAFRARVSELEGPPDEEEIAQVEGQLQVLRGADVLVLQEVDWGLDRSGYRHMAEELGRALEMNWAYGVEFVEVDPLVLGTEDLTGVSEERRERLRRATGVDEERYRGLHGSAILSRYPIADARLVPLVGQGYEWYVHELRKAPLDADDDPEEDDSADGDDGEAEGREARGSGEAAEGFGEATRGPGGTTADNEERAGGNGDRALLRTITREVRRGGRALLLVDLVVEELPEGRITVAGVHLEPRATPAERHEQITEVLGYLRTIEHPVVVAGDMSTSGTEGLPRSWREKIRQRAGETGFWAETAVEVASGVGVLKELFTAGFGFLHTHTDPTVGDIPLLSENPEKEFFETVEAFRFGDGGAFDFRGDPERSFGGREGTLANSNQRDDKGFVATYESEASGPNRELKLDWIFVKAYATDPGDPEASYRFAPHRGRTLMELNRCLDLPLSNHAPITVDLPLNQPEQGE